MLLFPYDELYQYQPQKKMKKYCKIEKIQLSLFWQNREKKDDLPINEKRFLETKKYLAQLKLIKKKILKDEIDPSPP